MLGIGTAWQQAWRDGVNESINSYKTAQEVREKMGTNDYLEQVNPSKIGSQIAKNRESEIDANFNESTKKQIIDKGGIGIAADGVIAQTSYFKNKFGDENDVRNKVNALGGIRKRAELEYNQMSANSQTALTTDAMERNKMENIKLNQNYSTLANDATAAALIKQTQEGTGVDLLANFPKEVAARFEKKPPNPVAEFNKSEESTVTSNAVNPFAKPLFMDFYKNTTKDPAALKRLEDVQRNTEVGYIPTDSDITLANQTLSPEQNLLYLKSLKGVQNRGIIANKTKDRVVAELTERVVGKKYMYKKNTGGLNDPALSVIDKAILKNEIYTKGKNAGLTDEQINNIFDTQ